MPLGLPVATYGLYFMCNNEQGGCSPFVAPKLPELCSLYSFDALLVALAWFAFQAALYVLLPGPVRLACSCYTLLFAKRFTLAFRSAMASAFNTVAMVGAWLT